MKTMKLAALSALLLASAPLRASAAALADLIADGRDLSAIAVPVAAPAAVPLNKTISEGLPGTVRAFLDTLAYAEGTDDSYDYIYSFVKFSSYADHPRRVICSGGLCSDAAGRYQFLSTTWDELAGSVSLPDFSPASQDKACAEKISQLDAYDNVLHSDDYDNFSAAVHKLNNTWASLPGSDYGQPTHPMDDLWRVYQAARARY